MEIEELSQPLEGEATSQELDLYMTWLVNGLPQLQTERLRMLQELVLLEQELDDNENQMVTLMQPRV